MEDSVELLAGSPLGISNTFKFFSSLSGKVQDERLNILLHPVLSCAKFHNVLNYVEQCRVE